jgi:DNA gyrase subunit A
VREFKSRASTGVRAIKLGNGNKVVSMDILKGTDSTDMVVRDTYLKIPTQERVTLGNLLHERALLEGDALQELDAKVAKVLSMIESELDHNTISALAKGEEFILSITENGYGKRTSAYEYRLTNRGGSGIVNIITSARNGKVVASYQIDDKDQILLITTKGKLIRCPVKDVRVAGRNTQGVTIFKTADDEKVISVERLDDAENKDVPSATEIEE